MKIENISTSNWENAIRGMRNPYDSWHLSTSKFGFIFFNDLENVQHDLENHKVEIIRQDFKTNISEYAALCPEDIDLAQRLIKGGPVHSKFLRQIFISMDITAPLFLWKELDTYKVATAANSCSTMHTIQKHEIGLDNFEIDDYVDLKYPITIENINTSYDIAPSFIQKQLIPYLEYLRKSYNDLKQRSMNEEDPERASALMKNANTYWKELIRWLPEGWLQKRTWTGNYETARNILKWRDPHKLTEWVPICDALKSLPFANELLTFGL
jgi:hypothetical protein